MAGSTAHAGMWAAAARMDGGVQRPPPAAAGPVSPAVGAMLPAPGHAAVLESGSAPLAAALAHATHHAHHHHHATLGLSLHLGEPALAHGCRHALTVLHGLLDGGPDAERAHRDLQTAQVTPSVPEAPPLGACGDLECADVDARDPFIGTGAGGGGPAGAQAVFVLSVSKVGFLLAVKYSTGVGLARLPDGCTCAVVARSAGVARQSR